MTADLSALEAALAEPGPRLLAWDWDFRENDSTVYVCEVGPTGARRVFHATGLAGARAEVDALARARGVRIGALDSTDSYVWASDETYALWNARSVVAQGRDGVLEIGGRRIPRETVAYVHSFWDLEDPGDHGVHLVLTDGERVRVVHYRPDRVPDPFVVSWYESEMNASFTYWVARDLAAWLGVEHRENERIANAVELLIRPFARELAATGQSVSLTLSDTQLALSLEGNGVTLRVAFAGGLVRASRVLREGDGDALRAYLQDSRVTYDVAIARNQLRTQVERRLGIPVLTFASVLAGPSLIAAWDSTDDRDTRTVHLFEVGRRGARQVASLDVDQDGWHDLHETLAERRIRVGTADMRRLCVWVGDDQDFTVWTDRKALPGVSLHGDRGWPTALARDITRWQGEPMRELRAAADRVAALPATGLFDECVVPTGAHQLRIAPVPGSSARLLELRVTHGATEYGRWLRMGTNEELVRYLRSLRTLRDIARAASELLRSG